MRFPYRLIIIIPDAVLTSSRNALKNVIRKQNALSPNLAPLGASVPGPITHFGSQLIFTEKQKIDFEAANISSVFWFLISNQNNTLLSVSNNVSNPPLGSIYTFKDAITKVNLIRK